MRDFILLFFLFLLSTCTCFGQKECFTQTYYLQESINSPSLFKRTQEIESFIKNSLFSNEPRMIPASFTRTGSTIIKIPVIVHVLYNNPEQKITEEQVRSQLGILNRDYRKLNPGASELPDYFKSLAADCFIEFSLATVDPHGKPTRGIVWKKTNNSFFRSDDGIKFSRSGGDDAWDADKYLNIWVGKLSPGMIGYSSPVGSAKEKDGIVLRYTAFGTIGTATAPYNLGRTAVHEIGHWLGLKHIWGDRYCGDDEIADTPPQKGPTPGCPSGVAASSCDNAISGSMYMNYMDVTHDACTNMFTNGQSDRMRALFADGGPRQALLYSPGCSGPLLPSPVELPIDSVSVDLIGVFPNPAGNSITVNTAGLIDETLTIYNQLGQVKMQSNINSGTVLLNIISLNNGLYFIKIGPKGKVLKFVKGGATN